MTVLLLLVACMLTTGSAINRRHWDEAEKTHDKGANHASQTEAALQSLQKDDAIEGDQRVALSADLVFILDVSSSVTNAGCNNVGQYNARLIKFMQATVSTYGRWIREDGVQVAAVKYSNTASVAMRFGEHGYSSTAAFAAISKFKLAAANVFAPTFAFNAFEIVRDDLFNTTADSTATTAGRQGAGRRQYNNSPVPTLLIILSDGTSREVGKLKKVLSQPPYSSTSVYRYWIDLGVQPLNERPKSTDISALLPSPSSRRGVLALCREETDVKKVAEHVVELSIADLQVDWTTTMTSTPTTTTTATTTPSTTPTTTTTDSMTSTTRTSSITTSTSLTFSSTTTSHTSSSKTSTTVTTTTTTTATSSTRTTTTVTSTTSTGTTTTASTTTLSSTTASTTTTSLTTTTFTGTSTSITSTSKSSTTTTRTLTSSTATETSTTTTYTSTTTTELCKHADVLFIIDGSSPTRDCNQHEKFQQFAARVVRRLEYHHIAPEEIRVGLISFGQHAEVAFDFNAHTDGATLNDALLNYAVNASVLGTRGAGQQVVDRQRIHAALQLAKSQLLLSRTSGFRNFAAKLVVITLTDGNSLDDSRMVTELSHSVFDVDARPNDVVRLSFGFENAGITDDDDDYYSSKAERDAKRSNSIITMLGPSNVALGIPHFVDFCIPVPDLIIEQIVDVVPHHRLPCGVVPTYTTTTTETATSTTTTASSTTTTTATLTSTTETTSTTSSTLTSTTLTLTSTTTSVTSTTVSSTTSSTTTTVSSTTTTVSSTTTSVSSTTTSVSSSTTSVSSTTTTVSSTTTTVSSTTTSVSSSTTSVSSTTTTVSSTTTTVSSTTTSLTSTTTTVSSTTTSVSSSTTSVSSTTTTVSSTTTTVSSTTTSLTSTTTTASSTTTSVSSTTTSVSSTTTTTVSSTSVTSTSITSVTITTTTTVSSTTSSATSTSATETSTTTTLTSTTSTITSTTTTSRTTTSVTKTATTTSVTSTTTDTGTSTTTTRTTQTRTTTTTPKCYGGHTGKIIFVVDRSSSLQQQQQPGAPPSSLAPPCNIKGKVKSVIGRIVNGLTPSIAVSAQVGIVAFDRYTTVELPLSNLLPWGSRTQEARMVATAAAQLNLTSLGGPTLINPALVAVRSQLAQPEDEEESGGGGSSSTINAKTPPPLIIIFSDGDSLNQHKVADEIQRGVHNATRRVFVNIGSKDLSRNSSTLVALLEQHEFAEANVKSQLSDLKLDCQSNEGALAARVLRLMPPYQVLCEGTTHTATSTTTTTTPCTATNDDDALKARAAAFGFSDGLLSCETAPETFCDPANELGQRLYFRRLCGIACGLCIRETSTTTTTPKVLVPIAVYSLDLSKDESASCTPEFAAEIATAMLNEFVRRGFARHLLDDVDQWCDRSGEGDQGDESNGADGGGGGTDPFVVVGLRFSNGFAAESIETFAAGGVPFVARNRIYLTKTINATAAAAVAAGERDDNVDRDMYNGSGGLNDTSSVQPAGKPKPCGDNSKYQNECTLWVSEGYCTIENGAPTPFMATHCALSCEVCTPLPLMDIAANTQFSVSRTLNMLDNRYSCNAANVLAEKQDEDSAYQFSNTEDNCYVLKGSPDPVQSEWTASVVLQQEAGTSGYIFAKTGNDGRARRHYALYSSSKYGLSLYYTYGADLKQAVARFKSIYVSDGKWCKIVIAVRAESSGGAMLYVKVIGIGRAANIVRQQAWTRLRGKPLDCDGNDGIKSGGGCHFTIGFRRGSSGAERGMHHFQGAMKQMIIFPNTFISNVAVDNHDAHEAEVAFGGSFLQPRASAVDWLDPNAVKGTLPALKNGACLLDGTAGFQLKTSSLMEVQTTGSERNASVPAIATSSAVSIKFRAKKGHGGYLLAQSTSSGSRIGRHLGLYLSASRRDTVLYYVDYASESGPVARSTRFGIDLTDGREYHLVLNIRYHNKQTNTGTSTSVGDIDGSNAISLLIDNIAVKGNVDVDGGDSRVQGRLKDCGSNYGDCVLRAGDRASSTGGSAAGSSYQFLGLVYEMKLHTGVVLEQYPT